MKEYRYRKHLFFIEKYLTWITVIFGGIVVLGSIVLFLITYLNELFILGAFGLFIIMEGLVIKRVYHKFTQFVVIMQEEGLHYINSKEDIVIRYDEITKISFPSIKYTGGWIYIEAGSKKIRLTVVLEHIQDLLFDLKSKLDERGKSDLYDEKKFYSFYKTSAYSDQSWDRLYKVFKLLILSTLGFLIGSIVLEVIIAFFVGFFNVFIIFLLGLLPTCIYIVSEIRLAKILSKSGSLSTFSVGQLSEEVWRAIYRKTARVSLIVCITLVILITIVNFL